MPDTLEDISDLLTDEAFKAEKGGKYKFRKGTLLTFKDKNGKKTSLKIVKINRTRKQCFAKKIVAFSDDDMQKAIKNHYSHNVDASEETIAELGAPWCSDCQELITD